MFKFRPEVTQEHKDTFVRELKKLKELDCVKGHRLIVGGPSVTDPIERSKGFEFALLSFHENLEELGKYQASKEHYWYVKNPSCCIGNLGDFRETCVLGLSSSN